MAFKFKFVATLDYTNDYGSKNSGECSFSFPDTLKFQASCGDEFKFSMQDIKALVAHFDEEKAKWTPPKKKKPAVVKSVTKK